MDPSSAPGILRRAADQASRLRQLFRATDGRAAATPEPEAPKRGQIIAIGSGKGGVGKTTIAVNLCIALARLNRRVVLVDADIGTANADLLCGITPTMRLDAARQFGGTHHLEDLAIPAPGGFWLIPGSTGPMADRFRTDDSGLGPFDEHTLARTIARMTSLSHEYQSVVIDTAAGVGDVVIRAMLSADRPIVVLTPEPTSIADAYALLKSLAASTTRELKVDLVVNQASGETEAKETFARISRTCARFLRVEPSLLGWLPVEQSVRKAVRARVPLMMAEGQGEVARGILGLAQVLVDAEPLRRAGKSPAGSDRPFGAAGSRDGRTGKVR